MTNDENEEEGELSPEKRKRLDILKDKSKEIMSEAVDIMSTDEDKERFENKFKELFKKHKIPWMFSNLKTFASGMEFGMFIGDNMEFQAQVVMHLERLVRKMEKDIKKRTEHI